MPTFPIDFSNWLSTLPTEESFPRISPARAYAHAEDQYDIQYGQEVVSLSDGEGLCHLLKKLGINIAHPALEVGCGSGKLTAGLANAYPGPGCLATDASPAFLRLAQKKLASALSPDRMPQFAIMNGGDLGRLPPGMISLIAMRSTLHHILDVEGFISDCSNALCARGALAMAAEPCESGYVLMGAVAQGIIPVLAQAGIAVSGEWRRQIELFTANMKFYCRRDLDKSAAEDKHLFRVFEMSALGEKYGLHLHFYPNAAFEDFDANGESHPQHERFAKFMLNYLRYCMSFDLKLVEVIKQHMHDHLSYIEECYSGHLGPIVTGTFLFEKK